MNAIFSEWRSKNFVKKNAWNNWISISIVVWTTIAYCTWQKRSFINFKLIEINFQAKEISKCWTTVESAAVFICNDFFQTSKQIFTSTFRRFSVVASLCMRAFHKETWPNADTNSWLSLLESHWTLVYLIRLIIYTLSRASNQAYTSQNNDISEFTL